MATDEDGPSTSAPAAGGANKRQRIYPDHKSATEVQAGVKAGRYHQGSLRVNRFNCFEAYVGSESVGQDILISGRVDMNRAMDGDIVAVELLPEEQWRGPSSRLPGRQPEGDTEMADDGSDGAGGREEEPAAEIFQVAPDVPFEDAAASTSGRRPTGKVIGIIRRNWRSRGYCGSLQPLKEGQSLRSGTVGLLFEPVDRRLPRIRVQTRQASILMDQRLVVAIDGWDTDSQYPSGHYVRSLGRIGEKATETEVLLIENDINTAPFTPAVHDCVPPLPWSVTQADINDPTRQDLRDIVVCSVDPPGCKDIDDALHARQLPNGNYEVGVHIADVTHFLRPGSAMDMEASARATTTYLVDRRIDMLPKPLTEDICSLRGGVERLAFSVI